MRNITAIYCRLAQVDDDRIGQQEANLRQYAEACGYANIISYIDNGASAFDMNRPALAALHNDITTGKVKTVIVGEIARIGRDAHKVCEWMKHLKNFSVKLVIYLG